MSFSCRKILSTGEENHIMNIRRERGEDKLCHILLFPQVSLNSHRFYCFKFILFSIRICPPLQGAGPGRARRGRVRDKSWCPPEQPLQRLAAEVREAEAAPRLHRGPVAAERGVAWHWTTRGTERLAAAGVCLQKGCPLLQG